MRRKVPNPGKAPNLPPSKKVLYNTVHVPWMEPSVVKELIWRRNVYNNAVVSLRRVFKEERQRKEFSGFGLVALKKKEKDELEEAIAENDKRNAQMAEERKIREISEAKDLERDILNEIEDELRKRDESVKLKTQEVLKVIDECDQYITKENIEEKLKEALENPVVYDFAIDLQGKKLYAPTPAKYLEHKLGPQKGRMYDVTLGFSQEIAANKT